MTRFVWNKYDTQIGNEGDLSYNEMEEARRSSTFGSFGESARISSACVFEQYWFQSCAVGADGHINHRQYDNSEVFIRCGLMSFNDAVLTAQNLHYAQIKIPKELCVAARREIRLGARFMLSEPKAFSRTIVLESSKTNREILNYLNCK